VVCSPRASSPRAPFLRGALAALRGQGNDAEKPLWSRQRGVVPRRVRLRRRAAGLGRAAARGSAGRVANFPGFLRVSGDHPGKFERFGLRIGERI
jgi:hypothetical protein